MDKLLIIGAGIGQVELLKMARSRGIHVTVASIPGNYPCLEMADDVIYKNIYDRDAIVKEAQVRGITAVISDQNDLMMPTVAYVAEKMKLPGNKFDTVMSYCDKNKFRDICDMNGVPSPKHIAIQSYEDYSNFNAPFPWIVKPADSQSSIGISIIYRKEELSSAIEFALKKSPTHSAIIEEYFYGEEIVCEGFINDGMYYNLQFGDRRYFLLENSPIPSQTLFPSMVDKNVLDKILSYEQSISSYTHPSFAIVHSEYLYNKTTGEIRIVESALRGGGVYISSHLVPLSTGIDVNSLLLDKAMGIEIDIRTIFQKKKNYASGYVCFYLPRGVVSSIEGIEKVRNNENIVFSTINDIQIGYVSKKMEHKGMRLGPFLLKGESRKDLEETIEWLKNNYIIKINDSDSNAIIWN